jgi:glucosamine--fructose-6-phosphate aminotransferase (isomerizing)
MFTEAAEASSAVQAQLDRNAATIKRIGRRLQEIKPGFIITVARGSSDHAAAYAKYLFETRTGLFTASTGPSVFSVYGTQMSFNGCLCLLISQSGASPDLLAAAKAARQGGAYVVALVNIANSPLASLADEVVELQAGPETSVAATKSFIASLTALIQLVTAWRPDNELRLAMENAPELLHSAWNSSWEAAIEPIARSDSMYVLGRGLGLGIAYEAALKLKEVCGLHAEAFSSAEVLHGPVTIARAHFPVLVLAQNDQTLAGVQELVDSLARRDVTLITAGVSHQNAIDLPTISGHPVIEPILRIQSFYRMANALSLRLGLDPDYPPYLQKVTATV